MTSNRFAVMAWVGLVALVGCAGMDDDTASADGALSPGASCIGSNITECGFGNKCRDHRCVPAECHAGNMKLRVPAKACATAGTECEFEDGSSHINGVGSCHPKSCSGQDITDCGFGAKCSDAKRCAPAECHSGSKKLGIAPKECPAGNTCEFEDGASVSNGVGFCTKR